MFINHTNHPSNKFSDTQKSASLAFGEILDIPFPNVPSTASDLDVDLMVAEFGIEMSLRFPQGATFLISGEFTYTHKLVTYLKACGFTCVAACTERKVVEKLKDGKSEKTAIFEFVQYRKY